MTSAPAPRVVSVGMKTYFYPGDGAVYRLHDTVFRAHRHHQLPIGQRGSDYRIFVPESGPKRAYQFKELHESRTADPELLERQLRQAEYLATERPESRNLDSR